MMAALLAGTAVALLLPVWILAGLSQSLALIPAVLAAAGGVALALVGWGRLRLVRRETDEASAVAAWRAGRGAGGELFRDGDEALKSAARASQAYLKYLVPAAAAAAALLLGVAVWQFWRRWNLLPAPPEVLNPVQNGLLSLALAAGAVLAGSYFNGASRASGCRWLRPAATWLLLAGALTGLAGAAIFLLNPEWKLAAFRPDLRAACIGLGTLALFAAELLVNVIIDWYRPRTPGEEERPMPESRLLTLVTEPGGVARNVAVALDYQFGFKVSDAWLYRFLERTVIPFAAVAAALFWLMTCVMVVRPEQNALVLRWGRVITPTPLGPGLHVKLPWPVDTVGLFAVERVQELPIGYVPGSSTDVKDAPPGEGEEMGDPTGRVMLWSKAHNKEEFNFIVATAPIVAADAAGVKAASEVGERRLPVNVQFLAASIPLYYKVKNLYAFQYANHNGAMLLQDLANREVTLYLANVDFNRILADGRAAGGEALRRNIQAAADRFGLGVEVVFIGLQGIHPPVKVGKAFDAVAGAMEEKHEFSLKAEAGAVSAVAQSEAMAAVMQAAATGYRQQRVQVAQAEAGRFESQLLAYRAAPELYMLNSYLDILLGEGRGVRKYIVTGAASREVTVLNLEKKLRPDLLDLDLDKK